MASVPAYGAAGDAFSRLLLAMKKRMSPDDEEETGETAEDEAMESPSKEAEEKLKGIEKPAMELGKTVEDEPGGSPEEDPMESFKRYMRGEKKPSGVKAAVISANIRLPKARTRM